VLENGALPLDLLERHIDRWIATQAAPPAPTAAASVATDPAPVR
jgi:hypothetical protein